MRKGKSPTAQGCKRTAGLLNRRLVPYPLRSYHTRSKQEARQPDGLGKPVVHKDAAVGLYLRHVHTYPHQIGYKRLENQGALDLTLFAEEFDRAVPSSRI